MLAFCQNLVAGSPGEVGGRGAAFLGAIEEPTDFEGVLMTDPTTFCPFLPAPLLPLAALVAL